MKVICIDAGNCEFIKEGGVYTVFKEGYYLDEPCYYIEECRHLFDLPIFKRYRFIPLSNIDETQTQLYKEQVTEKV